MSYARKNSRNVTGSIIGLFVLRRSRFGSSTCSSLLRARTRASGHLWAAIAAALLACVLAFFVFSIFVRHDDDDDLHITSTTRNA